jgi:cell division protein ZapD
MTFSAPQGFYQQAMDANISFQLIRIWVALDERVYPEISVGKHRLSVRFYQLDTFGRPAQTTHDISFQMAFCVF